ncbi:MAG: hypothetical protein GX667_03710 [Xanthomonadaceae bacterium]|nr:hypothetical protein [Xanthomonadaceae bacterium]
MKEAEDSWDNEIVPRRKLDEKEYKVRGGRIRNEKRVIGQIGRKRVEIREIAIAVRRSLQLSYVEPLFQNMLQPPFKGQLYIYTIGRRYWVIGARKAEFANVFRFYEKEIRDSLEKHLNKVSQKTWRVPPFKVKVIPQNPDDLHYQEELEALFDVTSVPMLSKAEKRRHEKVKVLGNPSKAPNPDISSKIQAISAWLHEENKRFKQTEREKREKRLHDLQNG